MASWKALNIESDDSSDSEVDDIKEIQIEEALKDYQTALRLHSHGKTSYHDAQKAYDTLFKSEIFRYNESLSEYALAETFADQLDEFGTYLVDVGDSGNGPAAGVDAGPSTLPQILHLSYKNRGQFYLDKLQSQIEDAAHGEQSPEVEHAVQQATRALVDFAEALDKDELDIDLWRRAAKVSRALGSARMTRFCLESALEDEVEDGTDEILGMPSLEATITGKDLKKVQREIDDDLSAVQPLSLAGGQLVPAPHILEKLRLFPLLPERLVEPQSKNSTEEARYETLYVDSMSWEAIGSSILQRLEDEAKGIYPGSGNPSAVWAVECRSSPSPFKHFPQTVNGFAEDVTASTMVLLKKTHSVPLNDTVDPKTPIRNGNTSDKVKDENATPAAEGSNSTSRPGTGRKRSTHEAENEDGGRGRSKRIRARESIVAADPANTELDLAVIPTLVAQELEENRAADTYLFEILQVLCKQAGVEAFQDPQKLRTLVANQESASGIPLELAIKDFYQAMMTWDDKKTGLLTRTESSEQDTIDDSRDAGLAAFLESSASESRLIRTDPVPDDSITGFLDQLEGRDLNLAEVAALWLSCLLDPRASQAMRLTDVESSYEVHTWSESMKQTVQGLVDLLDDTLYATLEDEALSSLQVLNANDEATKGADIDLSQSQLDLAKLLQSLYEIHLDSYTTLINPQNTPEPARRSQAKIRVEKWGILVRHFATLLLQNERDEETGPNAEHGTGTRARELAFRHLWASTFEMRAIGDVSREHLLLCIDDLRNTARTKGYDICLPNNITMRFLSVGAADREITKLETMDFFLSVFSRDRKDPVDLIERLEPVLMMTQQHGNVSSSHPTTNGTNGYDSDSNTDATTLKSSAGVLSEFLAHASFSLRFSLWQRLRESYQAIDYPPKVLTIDLKCIELILEEFRSADYAELNADERQDFVVSQLCEIEILIKKIALVAEKYRDGLDCLDMDSLRHSMATLGEIWTLLHTVSLFDDHNQSLQKGIESINPFRTYQDERFHGPAIKFHEMQIRVYMLWYKLALQAMGEVPASFTSPLELRWDYLRHIHHALGVRRLCKSSDSLFLKFMKGELEILAAAGRDCDDEQAQILYDLYDLSCWVQPQNKQEHGCDSDYLDRATAKDLIDFVLDKAKKLPIKDLIRTELGETVDQLHLALGANANASSVTMQRNKKFLLNYLKQPLDPFSLFRALRAALDLSVVPVPASEASLAAKGWLFLRGQMTFARYKASKGKGQPGDMDELDDAISLFLQDLEYDSERWETWYALAKSYDSYIEEQVVWSADKLNTAEGRSMLGQYQRNAIHAYAMAVAVALRVLHDTEHDRERMAELYTDYGMRVYASARPPFTMGAFSIREFPERFASSWNGSELYKRRSFKTMKGPHAWNYARVLFERAEQLKPGQWHLQYMLGKCSWKLYMNIAEQGDNIPTTHAEKALDYFLSAIERLPDKKTERRNEEPILEPIYKTVATLHKAVEMGALPGDDAFDTIDYLLRNQNQFDVSKVPQYDAQAGFGTYALAIFKLLRNVDKSKWHHRVVFRAAQVMYEQGGRDEAGAKTAKEYLLDQHMYSQKTLGLTIWKPDNERAGRHWVYMSRYCEFLLELLDKTNDFEAMQILTRRVRKKAAEFFEHERVWVQVVDKVIEMYRRHGEVVEGVEDTVFKNMTSSDFETKALLVDAWIAAPETQHVLIDVVREIAEIKKINSNLAPVAPIDAMLGDAYASIFAKILPTLPPPPPQAIAPRPAAPSPTHMAPFSMVHYDGHGEQPAYGPAPAAPAPGASEPPRRVKYISRREYLKHCIEAAAIKTASLAIKTSRAAAAAQTAAATPTEAGEDERAAPDGDSGTHRRKRKREDEDAGDADESELSEPDERVLGEV